MINSDNNFSEKLNMGISAENLAYDYLVDHNSYVEDLRQQKHGEYAGPCLCGTEGKVILPDFIVYNKNPNKGTYALDVKAKKSLYTINGKKCFTVDNKYEDYRKAAQLKRLDYLAIIFVYNERMYFYKETDCAGTTTFQNQYGNGLVYYFIFDESKVIY